VCCSAEAHVRDLRAFQELGYKATAHTAFDMFPFSRFVENVTMLFPQ
jgi:tRNA/tmRNA/rRNA uracil-C5-methylase (TrmA/RlmC/RlmD family)